MLALSAVIFHAIEEQSTFLSAFHRVIDFCIGFSALVVTGAMGALLKLRKQVS